MSSLPRFKTLALATALAALTACSSLPTVVEAPGCPSDAAVAGTVAQYLARQPIANPPADMSIPAALCARDKFVRELAGSQGRIVGYKAGLTNVAVQKRFNYPSPVRGTLFEKMILANGAEVPANFGTRPLFEADMLVEVGSSAIHEARTPAEVLANLRSVRPFIELPDLAVQDPGKIGGAAINAINVGARLGVMGAAIPAAPDLLQPLADMIVRVQDADNGSVLDAGYGTDILDHPLNAVIWLAGDLRKSGITLKPGDLLSLGSFSKLMPPKAGLGVKVRYEGLPGNPEVEVRFR